MNPQTTTSISEQMAKAVRQSLTRSDVMSRIKSKNTGPERLVRSVLTDLGYRYRLHRTDIPGKPDIAFVSRKAAIFVHGCFWHGHDCKRGARVPKTNKEYWIAKITRNRARDAEVRKQLESIGWRSLTVFECELRDHSTLSKRLCRFLNA